MDKTLPKPIPQPNGMQIVGWNWVEDDQPSDGSSWDPEQNRTRSYKYVTEQAPQAPPPPAGGPAPPSGGGKPKPKAPPKPKPPPAPRVGPPSNPPTPEAPPPPPGNGGSPITPGGGGGNGSGGGGGNALLGLMSATPQPGGGSTGEGYRQGLGMRQPPPLMSALGGLRKIY